MAICFTESLYPVKTKYIVADFSHGKEIYEEIEKQLSGIPIGILGKFQVFLFSILRFKICNVFLRVYLKSSFVKNYSFHDFLLGKVSRAMDIIYMFIKIKATEKKSSENCNA